MYTLGRYVGSGWQNWPSQPICINCSCSTIFCTSNDCGDLFKGFWHVNAHLGNWTSYLNYHSCWDFPAIINKDSESSICQCVTKFQIFWPNTLAQLLNLMYSSGFVYESNYKFKFAHWTWSVRLLTIIAI